MPRAARKAAITRPRRPAAPRIPLGRGRRPRPRPRPPRAVPTLFPLGQPTAHKRTYIHWWNLLPVPFLPYLTSPHTRNQTYHRQRLRAGGRLRHRHNHGLNAPGAGAAAALIASLRRPYRDCSPASPSIAGAAADTGAREGHLCENETRKSDEGQTGSPQAAGRARDRKSLPAGL